jgi:8-oxo-dGTP pyrophosphatase MutT (NUDIX family)
MATSERDRDATPLVERDAVRAIILTPQGEVLLMKFREPESGREIWLTPGGGIERNEDPLAGLHREIREETGLDIASPGRKIWIREHTFRWDGHRVKQRESFYLIRTERFEPHIGNMHEASERVALLEFRWWRPGEIASSAERFAPRRLGPFLEELARRGAPDEPVDVGV